MPPISFNSQLIDTMERKGSSVIVTWKTGSNKTEFLNISSATWTDWKSASSVGGFYHANIKGNYETKTL